jgi:hypothetical protein
MAECLQLPGFEAAAFSDQHSRAGRWRFGCSQYRCHVRIHVVSEPKASNEYRVFVLGDSAVWGIGLTPAQTLPGQMDALGLKCGNKNVRVYNLSFPRPSATKDLMILDESMKYQPDEIVWILSGFTLMPKTRIEHPLIPQNPDEYYKVAHRFDFLPRNYKSPSLMSQVVNQVIDQNRTLFRILRYQLYSLVNLATGLDQIPGPPEELPSQLSSNATFEGMKPPKLTSRRYRWIKSGTSIKLLETFP